jgi:predicted alpha/beta hydrolase
MDRRGAGMAWEFRRLGYDVWNVDFRGHGGSGPSAAKSGTWTYDDIVAFDIPALVRTARASHDNVPLVWVGHSLGAHAGVASLAANHSLPIDRLISVAGGVWMPSLEPNPVRWAIKRAVFEGWYAVSRGIGYCPSGKVGFGSDDEALPYVAQLVENGRLDQWCSVEGEIDYLREMRWIEIPILNVVSEGDPYMCHPVCAREWLGRAQRSCVTHRLVGSRSSDETGIGHMGLVLDERMRRVWSEIATWALTV